MTLHHSIRFRLSLGLALVFLVAGTALVLVDRAASLRAARDQTLSHANHEINEVKKYAEIVDPLKPDSPLHGFQLLLPEPGVDSLELRDASGVLIDFGGREGEADPSSLALLISDALRLGTTHEWIRLPGGDPGVRSAEVFQNVHDQSKWIAIATVSEAPAIAKVADRFVRGLSWVLAGALLTALGSWLLLSGVLRPVQSMITEARDLSDRGTDQLLTVPPRGSELGSLALVFNQFLLRSRKSIEQLSQFTSYAGHELRTPLARIRAESELALHRGDAEALEQALRSNLEEIEGLTRLVEALLLLSRGESPLDERAQTVDVVPTFDSLVDALRIAASERAIEVDVSLDCSAARIRGDKELLARALWILMDNAARYAPEDSRIDVSLSTTEEHACFRVTNEGSGISSEELARIFEPFHRSHSPSKSPGLGLGCAIARSIVERHGGTIEIDWSVESGVTATITLPLQPALPEGTP